MQLLLLIHHKVLAIPRMLIHSENNNILHTGNGIYIQIQLGLFTVQGLEGVACYVWAGWNLATDLGKWIKFKHDLWILCQLKCMICSMCRPCFKQIYFHDNQTLCSLRTRGIPCVVLASGKSLCIPQVKLKYMYVKKNLTSWIYCFFFWFCFVLFCFVFFNNSNISSECDIYSIQSQSLVLYNFALALKQVPWVLNSG